LDFIVIEMKHGAIDAGAAHAMIAATSGTRRFFSFGSRLPRDGKRSFPSISV
jgi:hypothetical protein